ncbi:hypothetical protein AAF143_10440 [Cyanobium sp. ATX-6F1]
MLAAIEHARAAGFDPATGALKLNAVLTRGGNGEQLLPLAELARERGLELRLIEFMDVGHRNGWSADQVLSAAEMVARLGERWPLEPVGRSAHGTASRWRYRDGEVARCRGGLDQRPLLRRLQPPARHRRWDRLRLPVRHQAAPI